MENWKAFSHGPARRSRRLARIAKREQPEVRTGREEMHYTPFNMIRSEIGRIRAQRLNFCSTNI